MRTFVFNGDNKQTEVKDANGATVGQYYYDGEGKRVKKYIQSTGETTIFVYSTGKLVAEYSTVVAPASVAKVAYTTTDHLGSPRVITDALGQVASRRDFMPFGEDLNVGVGNRTGDTGLKYSMPGDNVRQKFTGYQKDNETQLDFAESCLYEDRSRDASIHFSWHCVSFMRHYCNGAWFYQASLGGGFGSDLGRLGSNWVCIPERSTWCV